MSTYARFARVLKFAVVAALAFVVDLGKRWPAP
jgi:hypothetical protein